MASRLCGPEPAGVQGPEELAKTYVRSPVLDKGPLLVEETHELVPDPQGWR